MAAAPPDAAESNAGVEDFLARISGGWGASGAFHCLTPRVLKQIDQWFKGITRSDKVQCLLSFAHAKGAHLAKSAKIMQSIIHKALIDPDQWVQALAHLLDGYPETGVIQCAQVDNEFAYRLMEVVRLQRSMPLTALFPQANTKMLDIEEILSRTKDSSRDSETSSAAAQGSRQPDFTCVSSNAMKWIEDEMREQMEALGICISETGHVVTNETSPRAPAITPKVDFLQPDRPPRRTGPRNGNALERRPEVTQPTTTSHRSAPRASERKVPDASNECGLQWDVEGLEAAERAAVGQPSILSPASPLIRLASPTPGEAASESEIQQPQQPPPPPPPPPQQLQQQQQQEKQQNQHQPQPQPQQPQQPQQPSASQISTDISGMPVPRGLPTSCGPEGGSSSGGKAHSSDAPQAVNGLQQRVKGKNVEGPRRIAERNQAPDTGRSIRLLELPESGTVAAAPACDRPSREDPASWFARSKRRKMFHPIPLP